MGGRIILRGILRKYVNMIMNLRFHKNKGISGPEQPSASQEGFCQWTLYIMYMHVCMWSKNIWYFWHVQLQCFSWSSIWYSICSVYNTWPPAEHCNRVLLLGCLCTISWCVFEKILWLSITRHSKTVKETVVLVDILSWIHLEGMKKAPVQIANFVFDLDSYIKLDTLSVAGIT